jgi:predicted RNase H-like nuclease
MDGVQAILGIDAAWTDRQPSGVALIRGEGSSWEALAVAPSYQAFVALSQGLPVDWLAPRFDGHWPRLAELVKAAGELAGADVGVVAVDMPLATVPFTSRREADSAISRAFGARGCSTHSPTAARPGRLGANLRAQLSAAGFPLATAGSEYAGPRTIEVYPHPALLALLGRDYRVPYKVSRSGRYWKGASVPARITKLLAEFEAIRKALQVALGPLPLELPRPEDVRSLSELKRYEDALDALVCAWVGLRFRLGAARAYGDATASVWVPSPASRSAG